MQISSLELMDFLREEDDEEVEEFLSSLCEDYPAEQDVFRIEVARLVQELFHAWQKNNTAHTRLLDSRLVMDPKISDTSPVVKGTWVTVRNVVALIAGGWTWDDILRAHPELTEDDLRACLAYPMTQDETQN